MAIEFDAASSANSGSNNVTTLSWSHTCSGVKRILIVGIVHRSSISYCKVTSVTYAGQSLTRLVTVGSGVYCQTYLYYLLNPPTGTNTIQITLSVARHVAAVGLSYKNVRGIDNGATNSGNSTYASVSVSGISDGAWAVGFTGNYSVTGVTDNSGQTRRAISTAYVYVRIVGSDDQDGALGWTYDAAKHWAAVGVRLLPNKVYTKVSGIWKRCKVYTKVSGSWIRIG
ncbi:MAG: hypothetical protein ACTSPB_23550 [Candidatus Thorarchaeota archaeon]